MKLNAKYVVFSPIAVTSVYVLYHNERVGRVGRCFHPLERNPCGFDGTCQVRCGVKYGET